MSGGPDSMALFHGLREIRGNQMALAAVHVHHGIRGAEADRDAAWVVTHCRSLGVECFVRRIEPATWKKSSKRSVQARARELRYRHFRAVAGEWRADCLALGHTADDQAETLLLNLMRGTGLSGLSGIPPLRPLGNGVTLVIRPLIAVTRDEVLRYLREKRIPYLEDASNRSDKYLRNRVRRHLLPTLDRYNPRIRERLGRTADILRAEEDWMASETDRAAAAVSVDAEGGWGLSIPRLQALPLALQRRVLHRALRALSAENTTFDHVDALLFQLERWSGEKKVSLPGGVALRERDTLFLQPSPLQKSEPPLPGAEEQRLRVPGTTELSAWGVRLEAVIDRRENVDPAAPTSLEAFLDYERTGDDLRIRSRRPGDRFRPVGLTGTKKLQDFFVDARVPRRLRDRIPLLIARDGRVAWIIGHRIDERYQIRPGTGRVLHLTASWQEQAAKGN